MSKGTQLYRVAAVHARNALRGKRRGGVEDEGSEINRFPGNAVHQCEVPIHFPERCGQMTGVDPEGDVCRRDTVCHGKSAIKVRYWLDESRTGPRARHRYEEARLLEGRPISINDLASQAG